MMYATCSVCGRTGEDIRIYGAGLEPMPRQPEWWDKVTDAC